MTKKVLLSSLFLITASLQSAPTVRPIELLRKPLLAKPRIKPAPEPQPVRQEEYEELLFDEFDDNDDQITQEILINFAQIVNHFFNIALDPDNTATVGPAIGGIIQNVINIALIASKNDVEQLKQLTPRLAKLIAKKVNRLEKERMVQASK